MANECHCPYCQRLRKLPLTRERWLTILEHEAKERVKNAKLQASKAQSTETSGS